MRQKTTLLTEQQTRIQESMERANEELANGRKEIDEIGSRIQAQQQKVTESSQALHNLSVDELQREVVTGRRFRRLSTRAERRERRLVEMSSCCLQSSRGRDSKRLQPQQTR